MTMDLSAITRFELIDPSGRVVVIRRGSEQMDFELSLQDDGRTLKVLAKERVQVLAPYFEPK